ncbi:hypothetical protein EVAR_28592_1 [Eumeta japonica]|uniref:Uncharacterized protein n=1 Tax=Eumeta variegata TaxID=151549 RepID=A0A4C1UXI0_EUMVA|nr:hypothetical protein EVAR_28592_1 [Eumeta japonica]
MRPSRCLLPDLAHWYAKTFEPYVYSDKRENRLHLVVFPTVEKIAFLFLHTYTGPPPPPPPGRAGCSGPGAGAAATARAPQPSPLAVRQCVT